MIWKGSFPKLYKGLYIITLGKYTIWKKTIIGFVEHIEYFVFKFQKNWICLFHDMWICVTYNTLQKLISCKQDRRLYNGQEWIG